MQQMLDFQFAKKRHEELLREAEMNRRARALRTTGNRQAARCPEIGSGMGAKAARRTLPQASEDLMECRLGTGRHHLSANEGVQSEAARGLQDYEGCLI